MLHDNKNNIIILFSKSLKMFNYKNVLKQFSAIVPLHCLPGWKHLVMPLFEHMCLTLLSPDKHLVSSVTYVRAWALGIRTSQYTTDKSVLLC